MNIPGQKAKANKYAQWYADRYGEPLEAPPRAPRAPRPPDIDRDFRRSVRRELGGPFKSRARNKRERARDKRKWIRTRREAYARELDAARRRLEKRLTALGLAPEHQRGAPVILKSTWLMCAHTITDRTGAAGRYYLGKLRSMIGAALIRRAAALSDHGWQSLRVRRIVALGLFFNAQQRRTEKTGTRWCGLVTGIPRSALLRLLADPHAPPADQLPSINALAGIHRTAGRVASGELGYLRALEKVGYLYRQQLAPWARSVRPYERIGQYCTNRYWIVTSNPMQPFDDGEKARLLALIDCEFAERAAARAPRAAARAAGGYSPALDESPNTGPPG